MSNFKRFTTGILNAMRAAEVYYSGIAPDVFKAIDGPDKAKSLAQRTNKQLKNLLADLPEQAMDVEQAEAAESMADDPSALPAAFAALNSLDDSKQQREALRAMLEIAGQSAAWNSADLHKTTFATSEAMGFKVKVHWGKEDQQEITSAVSAGRIDIHLPPEGEIDPLKVIGLSEYGVYASHFMHDMLIADAIANDKNKAAGLAAASLQFINHMLMDGPGAKQHKERMTEAQFFDPQKLPQLAFQRQANDTDSNVIIDQNGTLTQYGDLRGLYEHLKGIAEKGLVAALKGSIKNEERVTFPQVESFEEVREGVYRVKATNVTKPMCIDTVGQAIANVLKMVPGDKNPDQNGDGNGDGQGGGLAQQIINMVADAQGQGEPQKGDGEQGEGKGQDSGDGEGEGEGAGKPEDGDPKDENERKLQMMAGAGDEAAKRLNKLLGIEEEEVTREESPIPWTELVTANVAKSMGIDKQSTWQRPNRRHIGQDLYLPGFKRKRVRRVASGIDESGSIDMGKLMKFNEEQIRLINMLNPEGWDIFHFSTSVVEENLTHGEIWEACRKLDGGTNFSAAFAAIKRHLDEGQEYQAIIFFTDLMDSGGRGLKKATRDEYGLQGIDFYWVTWGSYDNQPYYTPEFGTLINMDTNEIREFGE